MFRTLKKIALIALLAAPLTACMSAYVENKSPNISAIAPKAQPTPVKVEVEAYSNGDQNEALQQKAQAKAVETLVNTKVFAVDPAASSVLKLKLNENFNKGGAFAKGFLTGFTFFLVGTTSEANYTMDVSLVKGGNPVFNKQYSEKVYMTAGATAGTPENARKVDLMLGPDVVTQDLILQFLKEYNR